MEPRVVRIAQVSPAARDQTILALEPVPELRALHKRPGQYCHVTLDGRSADGYFALIDPPGAPQFRFLLRAGGPAADALRRLTVGTAVTVDGPLGGGFPIERIEGRDVLLVSAGAGISAIRPLFTMIPGPPARQLWLYHGTRTMEHVPFVDELQSLQAAGARVTITVSSLGSDAIAGRVQTAIERDKPDLSNAVAFIAGMEGMVDALRKSLPTMGLAADRISLNY